MRAEHLQEWLQEHRLAEEAVDERGPDEGGEKGAERDKPKWELVVELLQTAFRDRVLAEEMTCQAVVLIPKGGGD